MSVIAGGLWLLVIQLADKIKSAVSRTLQAKHRDLLDEFLNSGERLWQRFNKLLQICEKHMRKAAKAESHNINNVKMGRSSGCAFVDIILGRDRELERTEKLMAGVRLWSLRFDTDVAPILRVRYD